MTDRERLIATIYSAIKNHRSVNCSKISAYILADGWIRPPCKVGDTVYQIDAERVFASKVKAIVYDTDNIAFDKRSIGKTVFLTPEEAEKALKEQEDKT